MFEQAISRTARSPRLYRQGLIDKAFKASSLVLLLRAHFVITERRLISPRVDPVQSRADQFTLNRASRAPLDFTNASGPRSESGSLLVRLTPFDKATV